MAFNFIQFQHGMSLPEFIQHFGTEAQCAKAVKAARWPGGFRCLRCDAAEHCVVGHGARKLFQCLSCRYQTSLTAGSLFEHTKLPLLLRGGDGGGLPAHAGRVVGHSKPRDLPQFHWLNTILGNLKTTLHGAFHSLNWARHADSHLAAFACRFNRRFDLRDLLARLIVDVSRCPACRIRAIRGGAEAHY